MGFMPRDKHIRFLQYQDVPSVKLKIALLIKPVYQLFSFICRNWQNAMP
jgi:hypothetical protein